MTAVRRRLVIHLEQIGCMEPACWSPLRPDGAIHRPATECTGCAAPSEHHHYLPFGIVLFAMWFAFTAMGTVVGVVTSAVLPVPVAFVLAVAAGSVAAAGSVVLCDRLLP